MTIKKVLTLCMVYKNPDLLLGMKKIGFGAGSWNGFGGKVMDGEFIEEAAKRELKEEVGMTALNMEKVGILNFTFEENDSSLEVHLFQVNNFRGEPIETNEMRPQWFHKNNVPYDEMWPDDKYWLPLFLEGKKFNGNFHFLDTNTLVGHNINLWN